MKKPYVTHTVSPRNHLCAKEAEKVMGVPRTETEKSPITRLRRIIFRGVHSCKKNKKWIKFMSLDVLHLKHYSLEKSRQLVFQPANSILIKPYIELI